MIKSAFKLCLLFSVAYAQEEGSTNANVYRPCPNFELQCIQNYFLSHSNCRAPSTPFSEPAFRSFLPVNFPSVNITLFRYDVDISGLDGTVTEFFIDYDNGYTVLNTDFINIVSDSRNARYQLNRKAQVPIVEYLPIRVTYPSVSITTFFPSTSELSLFNSFSYGFANANAILVPGVPAEAEIATLNSDLDKATAESLITTTTVFANIFIQGNICDFGIE